MTTTVEHLPGAKITAGPQAWQVLQRATDGCAPLTLAGTWDGMSEIGIVEVRVASEHDLSPLPGCDWQPAEMLEGNAWRITLRVPTGGLYAVETRLSRGIEWRDAGDKIWHVAVGDIWVIAGQSNAVGYGHGTVVDPPMCGVSLFGGNESWRMATHPIFDPTGTKYPANRDSGWVGVSPWLAFGKEVLQATGVPIGFIPAALGGSPLCAWDPGNPDGAYLYDNMVKMIEAASGAVAGMLWYQGCSDTGDDTTASTYLARFTRFIDAFRARYGAELPVITAQLNRHLDAVPESDQRWAVVREAQRQAAHTIDKLAVVPTLDLPLSDGIHNSAVGNVTLGQRFARMALGMAYGKDIYWQPVDVCNARFANTERTSVRVHFNHVVDHLVFLAVASADFQVADEAGTVPVTAARVEDDCDVVLELGRAATGATRCHHLYGGNPPSTLRDHLQRPTLAFYAVPVTD